MDNPPIHLATSAQAVDRQLAAEIETWHEDARRFMSAFTHAAIGMALVSPDGRFLQVNQALCRLIGYSRNELLALNFQSITHADDLTIDLDYVRKLSHGEIDTYQMEKRYRHKDGRWIWGLLSVSLIRDSKNAPLYFISQIQDINELKKVEAERQAQNETMRALVEHATDIISRFDSHGRIQYINPAITALTGRPPEFYVGKKLPQAGLPEGFPEEFEARLSQAVCGRQGFDCVFRISSSKRYFHARFVPEFDGAGQIASILVVQRDITDIQQKQQECEVSQQELKVANQELAEANLSLVRTNDQLRQLANYDGLTGLKNRRRFDERLGEEIVRAERSQEHGKRAKLSLVLVDIDHFKKINDTYGHATGDEVLHNVAKILQCSLRPSDVAARYGGEEFALLLFDTDATGAGVAMERCRKAIAEHTWSRSRVTASLGATTWAGEDAQTLLVRADLALYAAKRDGRNLVRHFSDLPVPGSPVLSSPVSGLPAQR